jgi:Uma2 family endonuclease
MEGTVSLPQLKHPGYTLEDWKAWEGHWELINGVAYPTYGMTPAQSPEHQRVSRRLERVIEDALEAAKPRLGGGGCEMLHAPLDVFLDTGVFQPDIVVVCDPAKNSPRGIEGPPDLVVEILSPGTAGKDWTHKRWAYEAAGVPEYLLVDPDGGVAVLLRLEGRQYTETVRAEWGGSVKILGGRLTISLG